MMTPDVKEKIKGKTTEEITAMIKSKEIVPPTDDKGRDEFLLYASKKPEERDVSVNDDPTKPAPVAPVEAADKGGSIADDTSGKWWEKLGNYASAEEAVSSHTKVLDLNKQLQTTLDSINAKEGKRGRELKELKEERDRILGELKELKIKTTPVVTKPERPVRPNPKDFPDGRFDEKYLEAKDNYDLAFESYSENMITYERTENQKKIDELKTVVVKKDNIEEPVSESGGTWGKLYNEDIPAFQKKFGCETTVSVGLISENLNKKAGLTTKDPDEIARASAFIDSVPKRDMELYVKIRSAVEKAYTFDNNGPVYPPRYAKGIEGAVLDHDMLGEGKAFNIVKPSSLTTEEELRLREKKKQENESSVSTIPGDKLAGGDESNKELTTDEKRKRYKDLMTGYNVAIRNGMRARTDFEASAQFQEFKKLGVGLKLFKADSFGR
jgi:hypothetical protein